VHTHSSKAGVLGRVASLATRIGKRVHTPHTFSFLFTAMFGPAKRRMYRSIETFLARTTARVIAVSPGEAETFRRSGVVSDSKIRVVPNGIDPARFADVRPIDIASFGLDPTRPTAAVIGLVYAGKGQDLALQCLARPACSELQLLVVGPGDLAPVEALARSLGIADRVRVTGPRNDVPALLAAIDFLILPSRWEGMPYIVLEAMASARAVAATPVDGARDLVVHGTTGRIAERIDADALAAEVAALLALAPAERAAMGAAGRARVLSSYRVEAMVERTIGVYEEVGCASCT
jgi:glycosyltransferase involved in cell wall biosynthesis